MTKESKTVLACAVIEAQERGVNVSASIVSKDLGNVCLFYWKGDGVMEILDVNSDEIALREIKRLHSMGAAITEPANEYEAEE